MSLLNRGHRGQLRERYIGEGKLRELMSEAANKEKCGQLTKENGGYASGRLAFLNEKNEPISGNNKPQFVLVFNPFKIAARHTVYIEKSSLYGA